MALTTNLVAYWKLDESSGNASDATGNGKTLTNNATVTYAAAKINNGAVFNGANYLSNTGLSASLVSSPITIAGWAKYTTVGSSWGFRNDTNCDFYFNPFSSTQAEVRYRNSSGTAFTFTATGNFDSTFRHYVITWDGTTAICYQNGTSIGSVAGGGNTFFTNSGVNFTLGRNEGSGSFMTGSLDEVGLWSRALSSTEVSQLYNSGAGLAYPLVFTGIAFGGIAGANVNLASGTSVAVSGTNTVGFVLIQGDVAADNITGITWGGVAMTKVTSVKEPSDRWLGLWWVANPSSGGTITATGGAFWNWYSFYYTGAHQTSPIDSFNTGTVTSTAALSIATTVVGANCWYVMGTANTAGNTTYTSTGTLRLSAATGGTGLGSILDSNATIATGSQSFTSTAGSALTQGGIAISLAPAGAVVAGNSKFFTFM